MCKKSFDVYLKRIKKTGKQTCCAWILSGHAIVAKIEEEIIHLKELCTDMSQKDVWVLKYAIKEIWTVFELKVQVLQTE